MPSEIMSLGWYVRFVPLDRMEVMDDFYANVLGLPRVWHSRVVDGKPENKDLYWAGEALIENHNCGGRDAAVESREADPRSARQLQFYRVSELDAIVDRLRARGVTVHGPVPCFHGREAYVLDPMRMLLGLRQRDPDSPLLEDVEAARRRRRGEAFNPGCGPMPPGWQELGWVRIRAADLAALRNFYRDTVGLPFLGDTDGCARFDLGDNTVLELGAGGVSRPPPAMQMSSLAAMIFRVRGTATIRRSLKSAGVHFVHDLIPTPKGELSYFADPEGNVIGLSERTHPGTYVGPSPTALPLVTLEDAEAQRRWVEAQHADAGRGALEAAFRAGLEAAAGEFDRQAQEAAGWIAAAANNTEMQQHAATRLRAEFLARKIRALGPGTEPESASGSVSGRRRPDTAGAS